MGNAPGGANAADTVATRLEERLGRIALTGRYHKEPKRMDEDYEVQNKVLGSGCNGVVREARRIGDGKKDQYYAVKAFPLADLSCEKRSHLLSEVEIFLTMDHPHVARLVDVYEQKDWLYFVMERMAGGELFAKVSQKMKFPESDAADSCWQMLLAVNYLHEHGIVHRDLKLENFLYDEKGSNHLKLIDFGFSKIWDPSITMHLSCGTLSYVAPEVLKNNYTNQCDMWSLGVIAFILLSGYMPFHGPKTEQMVAIVSGKYEMKPSRWNRVSKDAQDFIHAALQVKPDQRLTAKQALDHPWLAKRNLVSDPTATVDEDITDALIRFGHASKFRRCCLGMMAWSLTNQERSEVRDRFVAMDKEHTGTIKLAELKEVLTTHYEVEDSDIQTIFNALDANHSEEINYTEFLAAMLDSRIRLHGDLLRAAFKKFDVDDSGHITTDNLRSVLGESYDGDTVEQLLAEATLDKDKGISYADFVTYIRRTDVNEHVEDAGCPLEHSERGETDVLMDGCGEGGKRHHRN
eukprot:TRINITY_DN2094_c1_g1_i1.p1 TRINITY_DN2094_c1_g1~~TRINITY_DN2094_c1_g1_i1.p1  ORF type:complete len:535 (-),score=94.46 TRINITY_DN2094_c1_g1_i1:200-1759(-)